ncbi:MAG TPA: gephyrin-like molybdotransferase Glp [Bryobacteraceae bacterium]|nr:gephyrin-like molybdotransferase Glp [Bryobacteraceae bacterium]
MSALSFHDARRLVLEKLRHVRSAAIEYVDLDGASSRVLGAEVRADRDYPPVDRSVRDGFAVRAGELPGEFEVTGEVRAGETSHLSLGTGQAIEIMTGAAVPPGADAIVMVEHTTRNGSKMRTGRMPKPGEFINRAGSEARSGEIVLARGDLLTFSRIAMLAAVGMTRVPVFRKPSVAILSTGDEVVAVESNPETNQVRNSNAWAVAAQVRRSGGEPLILPVARDLYKETRRLIEQGLESDLLLLSGGVSAGKYDLVEQVLADLGAEFFFTRVLIQPGQPLVFGRAQDTFFFGLPGNPASTMVTFEVFGRAAVEALAGQPQPALPLTYARLTREFRHKTGLTRFLPALLARDGLEVTPVAWQGSSDVPALARANAFLVAEAGRESWPAGDFIPVLPQ